MRKKKINWVEVICGIIAAVIVEGIWLTIFLNL